jgi:hypothetical protein
MRGLWIVVCAAAPLAACAGEPGHATTTTVGTDDRGLSPRSYFPFDPPLPPNLWPVEPPPRLRRTSGPAAS